MSERAPFEAPHSSVNVSKKSIGKAGEEKAARYLAEKGYCVVAQNWQTKSGEIDIIALSDDVLVFAEVKTLPNGNADMLSRVLDGRKQKKIIETSKRFLSNNRQYSKHYIRYDVIVVDMPSLPAVYHIENAFSELV